MSWFYEAAKNERKIKLICFLLTLLFYGEKVELACLEWPGFEAFVVKDDKLGEFTGVLFLEWAAYFWEYREVDEATLGAPFNTTDFFPSTIGMEGTPLEDEPVLDFSFSSLSSSY